MSHTLTPGTAPPQYTPAVLDPGWLSRVTASTAWRTAAHTMLDDAAFPELSIGSLGAGGTADTFDLEHDATAWLYQVDGAVSRAVVNPTRMTLEQRDYFGFDRAVLFTHEKRAIAHRGNLLRLWLQRSSASEAFTLLVAPTALSTSNRRRGVDSVILPTAASDLREALRDAVVTSARMNATVMLARRIDRQDLY